MIDGNARHLRAFKWAWICVLEIMLDQLNAIIGTAGVVRVIFMSNELTPVTSHLSFVSLHFGLTCTVADPGGRLTVRCGRPSQKSFNSPPSETIRYVLGWTSVIDSVIVSCR